MTGDDPIGTAASPVPAASEEEFVQALRRMRERSGLTFKEIERLTSRGGPLALPASTLATALQRRTVPRAPLVTSLVLACGGTDEDVAGWLAERDRLLHPETGAPPPEPPPEPSPAPRRRVLPVVLAVAATAAVAGAVAWTSRPSGAPGHAAPPARTAPSPSQPPAAAPAGDRLRLGGLCLTERRQDKAGLIYLAPCADAFPPRRLARDGAGWRVTTRHPTYGAGCMGVLDGSPEPGKALSDDVCGGIQTDRYTLRRVPGGYRLQPGNGDLCVGVRGRPSTGAQVFQLPCTAGDPGQTFTIP
ncbi:RICIN domain-containing protein [Actinomadura parmotrematis]|uniref:RICIN domain-containing protein n=1 Tax=Actinomadura parmotrematis TaxID=2864039 RepID=A0ABS7FNR8_9ACTN|nr:RICIN domain-containing protein [Actinomadura parmotrematis]MBW8481885.1 RICIN domain-containing protein [Actinomadura parmotrematis]